MRLTGKYRVRIQRKIIGSDILVLQVELSDGSWRDAGLSDLLLLTPGPIPFTTDRRHPHDAFD